MKTERLRRVLSAVEPPPPPLVLRYLGKYGYLASISAVHSNKHFEATQIRDNMFVYAEEDVYVLLKSTNRIFQSLKEIGGPMKEKLQEARKEKMPQI